MPLGAVVIGGGACSVGPLVVYGVRVGGTSACRTESMFFLIFQWGCCRRIARMVTVQLFFLTLLRDISSSISKGE